MPNAVLSAELEAALLRELAELWILLNYSHFRDRMRPATMALHDATDRLGFWSRESRTISLSRRLVLDQPWSVVREVLKHEIAHQFVDEVLGIRDQTAHGPAFADTCKKLGFDAAATGLPRAADTDSTQGGEASILRRIAKLLALSDSPNRNEAELAMKQAQRLMLKHNLDAAAVARSDYGYRHVGTPSLRRSPHEQILAGALGRHFFVQVIWIPWYLPSEGRSGKILELCGTPANLDVAMYVHDFMLETSERLWRDHKRTRQISSDRERRRFLLGVMMGFRDKLAAGERESQQEGLVWTGDPQLETYFGRRYPRLKSGGSVTYRRTEAYESGLQAGRNIVLHRPITTTVERGRFLPGVQD